MTCAFLLPCSARALRAGAAVFGLVLVACGDGSGPGERRGDGGPRPDGGPIVLPDTGPPSRPPPDTIVPCRQVAEPRTLFTGVGTGAPRLSVAPGVFDDELLLATPRGESAADRVSVERVNTSGVPFAPAAFATPSHPRTASPALVGTAEGEILVYLHDGFPPFRAYLSVRRDADAAWSAPVPLTGGALDARRVVATRVGTGGAVVAIREVPVDGDGPARLLLGRVDADGQVRTLPAELDGSEGVGGFALASRGSSVTLVFDRPSQGSDGRDLVAFEVTSLGVATGGAPAVVAEDRSLTGEPAALRLPSDQEGSNDDVRLVAWSQREGDGVLSEVHLARIGDGAFEDILTSGAATGTAPALVPLFDGWFVVAYRDDQAGQIRMRVGRPFRTGGLAAGDLFELANDGGGTLVAASSRDAWGIGLAWTERTDTGFRARYGAARCTDRSP